MAIPMASAIAAVYPMPLCPDSIPANTTPTAIPSGMLWRVTAKTNIVVFFSFTFGPSACTLFICKWGIVSSSKSKNKIPIQNPINAGKNENFPICDDCSIAGIIRLQIDAATITPAANPVKAFCTFTFNSPFINNTQDAPNDVPKKGIKIPCSTSFVILITKLLPITFFW